MSVKFWNTIHKKVKTILVFLSSVCILFTFECSYRIPCNLTKYFLTLSKISIFNMNLNFHILFVCKCIDPKSRYISTEHCTPKKDETYFKQWKDERNINFAKQLVLLTVFKKLMRISAVYTCISLTHKMCLNLLFYVLAAMLYLLVNCVPYIKVIYIKGNS